MRISVLLPTRKRVERLAASVRSLRETARGSELEILLALDDDDRETIDWVGAAAIPGVRALVGPRVGYLRLHLYVNALAGVSTGEWLMPWNDDATMLTEGWDAHVRQHAGRFVVLNPDSNHGNQARGQCVFPIFPRRLFEALGHVAQSNHYDTYVEWIANGLGVLRDAPILVRHDRPDLTGVASDSVYEERQSTTEAFFGEGNRALVAADVERLRTFLGPEA